MRSRWVCIGVARAGHHPDPPIVGHSHILKWVAMRHLSLLLHEAPAYQWCVTEAVPWAIAAAIRMGLDPVAMAIVGDDGMSTKDLWWDGDVLRHIPRT